MAEKATLSPQQIQDAVLSFRDSITVRASNTYKRRKEQADEAYKEAEKHAVDKQAKMEAEQAHKEAIKKAAEVRDARMGEAQAIYSAALDQRAITTNGVEEAVKLRHVLTRAHKAEVDAKKQAEELCKQAKKSASDKQTKKEAEEAYKKALNKASEVADAMVDEAFPAFRDFWVKP